jgi:photosystem II stability/assembly factor-like uncharacterized protein
LRRPALALLALAALSAAAQEKEPKAPDSRGTPALTTLSIFSGGPAGLWRSTDWGFTWKKAEKKGEAGESPDSMGAVRAVLPIGTSVYVAGSGGAFASSDFGETWARWPIEGSVLSILPSRYPLADLTVFVGTAEGLLISEDAGRTFKRTHLWGVAVHRMDWPGPALVVGTGAGVAASTDMGATWAPPGEGLPLRAVTAMALSSFYPADPVLFAGLGTDGVFKSRNGGGSWEAVGLEGSPVLDLVWLGPFLYALTESGLYRSQDTGASWGPIGRGLQGTPQRLLFPLAPTSGAEVFVATSEGIWRSGDGGESFLKQGQVDGAISVLATFPQPEPLKPRKK